MMGKRVIIPGQLQLQAPDQLHSNHMDIDKKTTSERIDILNKYEHKHRKYCQKLFNMP